MGRTARVNIPGYYYHIIARGQRGNPLFFNNKDMYVFEHYLNEAMKKTDIEVSAYCCMNTHYHMLVRIISDPLDMLFKPLNTRYAMYVNRKRDLFGRVFAGRFKSPIITNIKYLYTVYVYTHNNPVRAGIVTSPGQYRFSSASIYNGHSGRVDIKKLQFDNPDLFDYSEIYNSKYQFIGEKSQFLTINKRQDNRIYKKSHDRRAEDERAKAILKDILKSHKISMSDIHFNKWNKKDQINKQIIMELHRHHLRNAQIARLLSYSQSSISRIIISSNEDKAQ
ncbi:MAG: transposase [bacterium]